MTGLEVIGLEAIGLEAIRLEMIGSQLEQVLKHIPVVVNKRLQMISSSQKIFKKNKLYRC